jgi:hypothetical protein
VRAADPADSRGKTVGTAAFIRYGFAGKIQHPVLAAPIRKSVLRRHRALREIPLFFTDNYTISPAAWQKYFNAHFILNTKSNSRKQ